MIWGLTEHRKAYEELSQEAQRLEAEVEEHNGTRMRLEAEMKEVIGNADSLGRKAAQDIIRRRPALTSPEQLQIPVDKHGFSLGMVTGILDPAIERVQYWDSWRKRTLLEFENIGNKANELLQGKPSTLDLLVRKKKLKRRLEALREDCSHEKADPELSDYLQVKERFVEQQTVDNDGYASGSLLKYILIASGLFIVDSVVNFWILKGYLGKTGFVSFFFAALIVVFFGIAAHLAGGLLKHGVTSTNENAENNARVFENAVLGPFRFNRLYRPFTTASFFVMFFLGSGIAFLILPRLSDLNGLVSSIWDSLTGLFQDAAEQTARVRENLSGVADNVTAPLEMTGAVNITGFSALDPVFWALPFANVLLIAVAITNAYRYHPSFPELSQTETKLAEREVRWQSALAQAKEDYETVDAQIKENETVQQNIEQNLKGIAARVEGQRNGLNDTSPAVVYSCVAQFTNKACMIFHDAFERLLCAELKIHEPKYIKVPRSGDADFERADPNPTYLGSNGDLLDKLVSRPHTRLSLQVPLVSATAMVWGGQKNETTSQAIDPYLNLGKEEGV
ncbi:hypothetical protein V5T82_16805 [Magnetovibrio sp. PR-2]|uniref:hypothetical protein n=1 Tax=Magnetovibrio sp. PR-2 TaxID=3120356 RepID=UPI002FCE3350